MGKGRMPKRILYLIDGLNTGGAQTALFNIITQLDRNKYEPIVIELFVDGQVGEALRDRGVYTRCLDVTRPFYIGNVIKHHRQLVQFARSERIDLVHSSLSASGIYGGLLAKRLGLPSVLNVHAPLSKARVVGWKVRYLELVARSLNNILIAGNRLTERELRRYCLLRDRERIIQIYNGINCDDGDVATPFSEDVVKLTMVANFFPEKDHLTLIKAYERLKDDSYPVHLQIIAEGDNTYADAIKGYIEEKNLDVPIKPARDVDTYTRKTDILVLTSHTEGDPLVLKEAMAVGVPVIATDVGAVNEVVDDGVSGILVPSGSVDGVVRAVEKLITDQSYRTEMAQKAIEKYKAKFTFELMGKNYGCFYDRIFCE